MMLKEKIASILIRLLASSWRLRVVGHIPSAPFVAICWHGEMLSVWKLFSGINAVGLTSQSKDGNILATLLKDWKYDVIRGSSSKGGSEALAEMTTIAKERILVVTPDGPRGPAHKIKAGAVVSAQRAGVQLVALRVECHHKFILEKSWDKFIVPLPFANVMIRVIHTCAIPLSSPRDEIEQLIFDIETKMNQTSNEEITHE
jgi:lysophospholipid acyltransferase (LPLAT)-like uncharacterized protein